MYKVINTTNDRTVKEWFRIVGYPSHGELFTKEDLQMCITDADTTCKNEHGETVTDVLLRTKYNMDDMMSNGHYKHWMEWSNRQQEKEGRKKQHHVVVNIQPWFSTSSL